MNVQRGHEQLNAEGNKDELKSDLFDFGRMSKEVKIMASQPVQVPSPTIWQDNLALRPGKPVVEKSSGDAGSG